MTMNVMKNIRKLMGWCPQKENGIFQSQTKGMTDSLTPSINPARKSNGIIEQMDIPLHFFDWRSGIIIIVLFISYFITSINAHVYGTTLSYLIFILIVVTSLVFLYLSYHYRVSINPEELLINTPLLSSIRFPKSKIESVKNIENIIYKQKHNWINFVNILLIIVMTALLILNLYMQITRSMMLEALVTSSMNAIFIISIFIILFYRNSYCSQYPRAIQIESGNEKITLCPRNEFEFNMMIEELKR